MKQLRLSAVLVALLFLFGKGITVSSADESVELTVLTPPVHKDRLMDDVVRALETGKDLTVKLKRPYKKGRTWSALTDKVTNQDGTILFASREDWTYRATEEDRQKLRYTPFARQLVHRGETEVGSVEYGFVVRKRDVIDPVNTFLDWISSPEAQSVLDEPDPYDYVPLDRDVVKFEQPEWFSEGKPGGGPRPSMWYGISHIWGNEYFSTLLSELKMMWMAGFNQATGVTFGNTDPFLRWAEDHSFILAQIQARNGQKMVDAIKRASEEPAMLGTYYRNEDHINRVYDTLYQNVHNLKSGETTEKLKGVKMVEDQFPRWLKKKHGDLKTLNRRWDTSYTSWDEIGFPDLPRDWVRRMYRETGSKHDMDFDELAYLFFHQPLHFHALAEDPALLDFQRYMREAWGRKYKAFSTKHGHDQFWKEEFTNYAKNVQPFLGPDTFYYTTKTRLNPYLFREVPEFNSTGFAHTITCLAPHYQQVVVDTMGIARDKPLWNAEDHLYNHDTARPRMVRYTVLRKYLMGMFRSSSYNRQLNFKSSRPDRHGNYDNAEHGPHYKEHVKAIEDIRRNESIFRAFYEDRASADVAVLVTEGNRGWNTLPDHPVRPEMGGAVKAYGHVAALGHPWKYVLDRDVSASQVTDVLIVDSPWLTPDTAEKIADLPDDRRIIAVGEMPTTDPYGESVPQEQKLTERAITIDRWNDLQTVLDPVVGMPEPYSTVSKGDFWFWGKVAGSTKYASPVPRLELRHVRQDGRLYVAIINHSSDREAVAPLPWAGGRKVRELTAEDPSAYVYPEGKHLSFPPYSFRLFEIPNGKIPVSFLDYHGRDPENDHPLGLHIEDAYKNHQMDVNNHWNTAVPADSKQPAWSIWKVSPESTDEKISELAVRSRLTAKKGEENGIFATVQWSLQPDGPWRDLYTHSFPAKTESWMQRAEGDDLKLNKPAPSVYLRMKFEPRGRGLMWWNWKVNGQTVGAHQ